MPYDLNPDDHEVNGPIRPETKELLLTAVERAKVPGGCRYTTNKDDLDEAEPQCVVAQILTLRGLTLQQLRGIEGMSANGILSPITAVTHEVRAAREALAGIEVAAKALQFMWDTGPGGRTEEDFRRAMRKYIERIPGVEPSNKDQKTYNHLYTVAFEVLSDDPEGAPVESVLAGLRKRLDYLDSRRNEVGEAVGHPLETYEE